MKISNPIKGFKKSYYPKGHKTQGFGENVKLYMAACKMNGHNGEDYVAPYGTPIYAIQGGIVCEAKTDPSGYGRHIRILSDENKKGGIEHTYGHLSKLNVSVGDNVKAGQKIGEMGNSGFVVSSASSNALGFWNNGGNNYNGTHLHLSIRDFIYDKKGWSYYPNTPKITILNYNNGWNGCIDFKDRFYEDPMLGDMEILKRELETYGEEPWYITFLRGLKFFNS